MPFAIRIEPMNQSDDGSSTSSRNDDSGGYNDQTLPSVAIEKPASVGGCIKKAISVVIVIAMIGLVIFLVLNGSIGFNVEASKTKDKNKKNSKDNKNKNWDHASTTTKTLHAATKNSKILEFSWFLCWEINFVAFEWGMSMEIEAKTNEHRFGIISNKFACFNPIKSIQIMEISIKIIVMH